MSPPPLYYENEISSGACDLTEEELEAFFNDTSAPIAAQSRANDAPRADKRPRPAVATITEKAPEVRSAPKNRVQEPTSLKDAQRGPVTPANTPARNSALPRLPEPPKASSSKATPTKSIPLTPMQTQNAPTQDSPPVQYKGEESVYGVRRMTIRQILGAKRDHGASRDDVWSLNDGYSFINVLLVANVRTFRVGTGADKESRTYTLFDSTGQITARMWEDTPMYNHLPKELTDPEDLPDERHILYVRVIAKLDAFRSRIFLVVTDLRPIKHPFEPYAHQFGCMYDTVRIRKAKGIVITSKCPGSSPQTVEAAKTTEKLQKAVAAQATTTTPKSTTTPKPAPMPKPAKTPAEPPSRSSSGFSSYVSVNEELAASDSAESFDMVEKPAEESRKSGREAATKSGANPSQTTSAHPNSFVDSPATSGMSSAYNASATQPSAANDIATSASTPSTTSPNDLTSVVSRLSLADEPYPDPDYSISGHLAANKVVGAVGRAQHSPPHGQRSSPRRSEPQGREQTTPRRSEPVTPQRATEAPSPHSPRTPQATTPDKSGRRRSKDHRRSSHAHTSPRTPELDTSPRSPDISPRPREQSYRTHETSPRSPQPLADLTTDQRNIILCIQKAYHKVGPHEQWIGVYHGDIAKYVVSKSMAGERSILSHNMDDVVAQAASISSDIETLVDKGYLTTTVDEDHFDCRDHSHGRYRRYTEILADLSLDDD